MSFPSIFDWLAYFDYLRGYPATWILLGTGLLIALFLDWRPSLLALIVQYLIAGLLFFDLLNPQLAFIKLFSGMFACLILYWTARQVTYQSRYKIGVFWEAKTGGSIQVGPLSIPRSLAERLAAVVVALALVAILNRGFSFYLPGFPADLEYINLAILLLFGLGAAGLVASRHPLPAGMSILTFLTGFELYFAALDQSTRTLALMAALELIVALIASYLTQRHYASSTTPAYDD